MSDSGSVVFFGAAGAGIAYCQHSGELPDFFVDNDEAKWGTVVNGVEVKQPDVLKTVTVERLVITSGYLKSILPQVQSLGIADDKIVVPAKAMLGQHPFVEEQSRHVAAAKLSEIMRSCSDKWRVVAAGGTALGFIRDTDFIRWDFDIDLFAPIQAREKMVEVLTKLGAGPRKELESIKANLPISEDILVPLSIDFYDLESKIYVDRYEDYTWEWPTTMFSESTAVDIHGHKLNVPNPPETYLAGIYGDSWAVPNPDFGYSDYAK